MANAKKPRLPLEAKEKFETLAQRIQGIQDAEEREIEQEVLARMFKTADQLYEMPTVGGAGWNIVKNLLAPFDYVGGIARTLPLEAALTAKEVAGGTMTVPKAKQAVDRVASAVLPFGELAPPAEPYLEKLGMGEGGRLSRSDILPRAVRPEYGSTFDVTGRGALGLGIEVASGGGASALLGKSGKQLAMKSMPRAVPGTTASQYTEQLANLLTPKSNMEKAKEFARGVGEFITNPSSKIGKSLYDFGLREANEATEAVTKRPFGDTLLESGSKAFTAKGIRKDVKNILGERTAQINAIQNPPAQKLAEQLSMFDNPQGVPSLDMPTTTRGEIFGPVFNSPQIQQALRTPGRTAPTQQAVSQMEQRLRDTALLDDGPNSLAARWKDQNARAQAGVTPRAPDADILADGPDLNPMGEALPAGRPLYKEPSSAVQSVHKVPPQQVGRTEGRWDIVDRPVPRVRREVVQEAEPARVVQEYRPDGSPYLRHIPAKPAQYRDVPDLEHSTVDRTWIEGEPIMSQPKLGAIHKEQTVAPEYFYPDILDYADPSWGPAELRRLAQSMQGIADDAGVYGQPSTFFHPSVQNQTAVNANKIEGWIANQAAKRARGYEMQNLDTFSPGAGGNVWRMYKDQASLREGAPYLSRTFTEDGKRAASTGLTNAMGRTSLTGRALGMLDGTGDATARGLGQYLMSPAQRYLIGPAAKSGMVNKIYDDEYNDPKRNPWGVIKKYSEGK